MLQEYHDIFCDVKEILFRRKKSLRVERLDGIKGVDNEGFKRLEDDFYPSAFGREVTDSKG